MPISRPAASLATLALIAIALLGAFDRAAASHRAKLMQFPPDQSTSAQSASTESTPALDAVQPIYSEDPADPWNRIFHALFTRTFQARISDEFPDRSAAPYEAFGQTLTVSVSTRTFARTEIGDGPVDPLYSPPANSLEGSRQLLTDPRYSALNAALQEALADPRPRTPLARALFQSDLWSAYDLIHWDLFPQDRGTILDAHKKTISGSLAQLIKKLSLSREEIDSLPDNYAAARAVNPSLPDLFGPGSGWLEIELFPNRLHDADAGFRRSSRVFVKPANTPLHQQKFLNSLRDQHGDISGLLSGAVILIQPLLVDTAGKIVPTHLTTDVEVRLFQWSHDGSLQHTDVRTYELSRRAMFRDPTTGGLEVHDENSPAYLSAGGSYGFAEPAFRPSGAPEGTETPLVVKLRTRCSICHGPDLTNLMSFEFALPPNSTGPPVKVLDPAAHRIADFDISQKSKRSEWRSLASMFGSAH